MDINEDRKNKLSFKMIAYWQMIDENYIKPIVIYDYPNSIEEDEKIMKGIKALMEDTIKIKKPALTPKNSIVDFEATQELIKKKLSLYN